MKNWKIAAIVLPAILLVVVNIYLTLREDSKVQRTVYVEQWKKAKNGSITESFVTKGVIKPSEEHFVYFNGQDKEFEQFLVNEGDAVSAGTPLFEYSSPQLETEKRELEAEKEAAEGEISSIEEQIDKLEDYQLTVEADEQIPDTADSTEIFTIENSSEEIISSIEQDIYQQEHERNKLEQRVKKYEAQIKSIEEQSGAATISSDVDGIVKRIDKDLGNPVIVIASNTPSVEGYFNEKQMGKASEGMEVKVSSESLKKKLNGSIQKINPYPVEEPTVKKESSYLFNGTIEEVSEKLFSGSKVNVTVITDKVTGVPVVPSKAVHKGHKEKYVYQLTSAGLLAKKTISAGLSFNGKQEVKKGLKSGNTVLLSAAPDSIKNAPFITPVKTWDPNIKTIKKLSKREKLRYVLIGVLEK
ncbi:RND transporter [Bacillus sp. M6-12]|uniref:efflux RND transporter periplasmic adaptor subunit n=1 Tax=Bacillus sp. M6-12 TaxID=2054166 RepID=UPI000C792132|nr:RND transporter [Bacillus sp. M6-12]PLS15881.1 RND transporter [Bacillus sp. M6-12]